MAVLDIRLLLPRRGKFLIPFFLITCIVLLLGSFQCPAQGTFEFKKASRSEKIPFHYHRNLIIIQIHINGKGPYNFILDTGVNFIILTNPALKDDLHLNIIKSILVRGLGEGKDTKAGVVGDLQLKIGNLEGHYFSAALLPFEDISFSSYVGIPIDGLIGYDFFKSFVVKINYPDEMITILRPEKFKAPGHSLPFALSIENLRPYIMASTTLPGGNVIKLKLIVDTGAGHPVSLEPGSDPLITVPADGLSSRLGIGLNGPIEGKLGRLPALRLGRIDLSNVICSFPVYPASETHTTMDNRNGNLGNEILSRFHVIFDYPAGIMYLKPNHTLKRSFEYDMSGLDLIASGPEYRNYIVSGTDTGSPADKAGLKESDILLYINLVPASQYSITEIDNLLRSGNNKRIYIVYQRGNQISFTQIVLKRRV